MVVFIDGKVAGVELLGRFEAFQKNHSKLVHSYVMDALETVTLKVKDKSRPSKAKAIKILESAATAPVEKRKSVALGEDVRLESSNVVGAGLEFEEQVLQMTIFLKDVDEDPGKKGSSIRRASRRKTSLFG